MPDDSSSSRDSRSRRRHGRGAHFDKIPGDASAAASPTSSGPSSADVRPGSAELPPSPLRPMDTKRLAIHPLELALLWIVGAHVVILPWALGSVRLPAQILSLVLATLGFVVALLPRNYTPAHTGTTAFRLFPLRKLLRFPIFWLGLALLALITIQGLNPAWVYRSDGKVWWMQQIPSIAWLPTGVRVPFNPASGLAQGGEWRLLIVYAAAFLTVCAIWIGFTRRRTLQRFFMLLAANGVALAIFGLAQRVLGFTKIFGFIDSPNASFFSSFIYKNHAGAYLVIVVAVATGLGAWYYVRGIRRLEKSSPAGLFAFFLTCIAVSVLVSYARGATFTMLAYLCIVVGAFVWYQWRLPKAARSPVITIAMLLVFAFFLKTGMEALHSDLAWDRLRQAISGEDLSVESRMAANRGSFQMLGDHWGFGVGSGAYPFLFPAYQQHIPEIAHNQFWPHAHNDLLELPIELGLPGVLLILGSFAFWGLTLVRSYAWENPLSGCVILGCLALLGMAWGDFIFFCPAVLITWCALWPAAARWAELEEQRVRG